ncbi:DUF3168 domain-containing protein [Paraburkholderia sp. BCC1885]|uniref:DUF3168 domain-containing protein n=1 Tax=Paraburkholderia sp. BCC1885 TaxID=2562669 RepID=UPI0011829CF7|nr:DUF3168 domain-containing protein [Paraburkholderia sp. BCC1885]
MASAESLVDTALAPFAGGRIYPDVAPAGAAKPFVVYQSVGGVDETTFDGLNEWQNNRMQVAVWGEDRLSVALLMQQILGALTAAPVLGTPVGAPVSVYEDDTKLYGSRADVSIWFNI